MASKTWESKVSEAQQLSDSGAKAEFSNDYTTAFQCYVKAGEIYLSLVRQKIGTADTRRLRTAAEKVLSRAETIKQIRKDVVAADRRALSEEEQAVALSKGSRIDSLVLPEWQQEHERPGHRHQSRPHPPLSPKQIEYGARYVERSDLPTWATRPLFPRPLRGREIVQRVVTDCSMVAGLEAAAEHDNRWGTNLVHGQLHPRGQDDRPCWSESNLYNVQLRINGKDRCISIDESIPCYADDTPMCAVGLDGDGSCVWPSLIEKAYISIRGGYDFGGSNSAIDLHALTGWIPEQVGLRHSGFQREKSWQRIKMAYDQGQLLLTAGTSKAMEKRQLPGQTRLIDSHDYAVLNLQEDEEGEQWITLMNPWEAGSEREIFRLSWNEACARLDSLYLNWSPSLFRHTVTWHGMWRKEATRSSSIQLVVRETCEVWLLLTRHITTRTPSISPQWIAMHIFGPGKSGEANQKGGVYVDSSHALQRVEIKPGISTIAASRQGDTDEASFSVFAYSVADITFQDLPISTQKHSQRITGSWTARSSGGNASLVSFLDNPQYRVSLSASSSISVIVETSKDIPVQVVMIWSGGKRVGQIQQGDIVASSGPYNYGLAMAECKQVRAGWYTVVVSTFDHGQQGDYSLRFLSEQAAQISSIPFEGAGMFHQHVRHRWTANTACGGPKHANYFGNPSYEIKVERNSTFLVRLKASITATQSQPLVNIAIFAKGTLREVVSSGPYSDAICGVGIEEAKLEPGQYLLIASTYSAGVQADYSIDIYSDRRIDLHKLYN